MTHDEVEFVPTEDKNAFRGKYEPIDFGGMTAAEHFGFTYGGYSPNDWIEELKAKEDEALRNELRNLLYGTSEAIVSKDATKEESIVHFRNSYRSRREEEQHSKGYYG